MLPFSGFHTGTGSAVTMSLQCACEDQERSPPSVWLQYDKLLSAEAQPRNPVRHLMRSLSGCCFIELTCLHSRLVLIGRIRDANIIKTLVPDLLVADEMRKSVQKLFMS